MSEFTKQARYELEIENAFKEPDKKTREQRLKMAIRNTWEGHDFVLCRVRGSGREVGNNLMRCFKMQYIKNWRCILRT